MRRVSYSTLHSFLLILHLVGKGGTHAKHCVKSGISSCVCKVSFKEIS